MTPVEKFSPKNQDFHIMPNDLNLGADKTTRIIDWVGSDLQRHFHFSSQSLSWITTVGWRNGFINMERKALYQAVFTSVNRLKDKIRRFIKVYN